MRYFLYARKSTDTEDKQVLSIEAQLSELRTLARRDGLDVAEEFIEKRNAMLPGRPMFEEMMRRVERGEAHGIVCWKIDRLSRNPVDSGPHQLAVATRDDSENRDARPRLSPARQCFVDVR